MYCVNVSKAVLVGPREKVTTKADRKEGEPNLTLWIQQEKQRP